MNFLRAALDGGRLRLEAGGDWAAPGSEGAVLVGVRPEHFVEPGGSAAEVSVKVDVVENLGGTRFIYGALGTGESVVMEARERTGVEAGDVVSFGIRPERAMLFSPSGTRLRNI